MSKGWEEEGVSLAAIWGNGEDSQTTMCEPGMCQDWQRAGVAGRRVSDGEESWRSGQEGNGANVT